MLFHQMNSTLKVGFISPVGERPMAQSEKPMRTSDVTTVTTATQVLSGTSRKRGLARLWPFLGPAFIASIAYVDPGNFATNIESGAKYGYTLLWVSENCHLFQAIVLLL
jgi:manganese transport protein